MTEKRYRIVKDDSTLLFPYIVESYSPILGWVCETVSMWEWSAKWWIDRNRQKCRRVVWEESETEEEGT